MGFDAFARYLAWQELRALSDLYREQILDHYRSPRNQGTLDPNDGSFEDTNPLCGDRIRIDLRIEDGIINDVKFSGRGCAISQASTSMLTEMVINQRLDDAEALTGEDMLDELGVEISPARLKCALLGLHVLHGSIYDYRRQHDDGS